MKILEFLENMCVFNVSLKKEKKFVEIRDAFEGLYSVRLNKRNFSRFIIKLQEIHNKMK